MRPIGLTVACVTAFAAIVARSQTPQTSQGTIDKAYLATHYDKYEYRIPARDGVKLYTAVYVPKDVATSPSKTYPILFTRTPYAVKPVGLGQYPEPRWPIKDYMRDGYIFAWQDVRGRYSSEGTFVHVRPMSTTRPAGGIDEGTDAWDTIDFLVKNVPGNNGRVGMTGMSYPGFYTSCAMIDPHPALKCASPQAPIGDWFIGDDVHHNGAYYLAESYSFLPYFERKENEKPATQPTPDGYQLLVGLNGIGNHLGLDKKGSYGDELVAHPNYDDYWKARDIRPRLKNVRVPVLNVGGLFDAEDLFGCLETYRHVERYNPGASNVLVLGPWQHGGWTRTDGDHLGDVTFGSNTTAFFREKIERPFFAHYLKDSAAPDLPEAWVFQTGANRWMRYAQWPPAEAQEKRLFLRENSRLIFENRGKKVFFDEFLSDPNRPVPFIGRVCFGMPPDFMSADQRFAATRPDVLVYQTQPLDEDLTVVGPIGVDLKVSTTGTDSDWVVKVIDVYPNDTKDPDPNPTGVKLGGYQQLVRGELMRGKYRESFEKPVPFDPGKKTDVGFSLPDVCHTFRKGHRMMVQVQSSWFPLFDRNPQTFCDIYLSRPEDYRKAVQRVYNDSSLRLRVMRGPTE